MSAICKLNPEVRRRRGMRRNLLRNPPRCRDHALGAAILAELTLIAKSSRLTGDTKHELFTRGATQLYNA